MTMETPTEIAASGSRTRSFSASSNPSCRPKVKISKAYQESSSQQVLDSGRLCTSDSFVGLTHPIEGEALASNRGLCDPVIATALSHSRNVEMPQEQMKQKIKRHVRSFSDCTGLSSKTQTNKVCDEDAEFNRDHLTELPSDFSDKINRPRFLDDGGSSIVVASRGNEYPKRQRGQSLVDYLMSNQSGKNGAELDRENAHFSVSEAMIAAIEETRFYEWKNKREDEEDEQLILSDVNEESDEEIRQMRMQLQLERFRPILNTKHFGQNITTDSSVSPTSSVSTITPPLSPSCSLASTLATIDMNKARDSTIDSGISFTSLCSAVEKERQKSRKLARLKRVRSRLVSRSTTLSGASIISGTPLVSAPIDVNQRQSKTNQQTSRRALFSPSTSSPISSVLHASSSSHQLLPTPVTESSGGISAESVALSLLGHFSQLQLPHQTNMEWLVSEKDAPQHLLPMPQSWPVNPDDPFMQLKENDIDDVQSSNLRGNLEWAPPRPQIVFAVYSSPNMKVVMAKQNFRCAGCGMRVEPEYSHSFRYCHYLGRYFCTACHSNKISIIPSFVFKKWDFKKYPVSNFSFDLLERMWFDPLFRLGYINPLLYRRCKQLNKVLELRIQMIHVGEFLRLCRFASDVWQDFRQQSVDWLEDPEIYSLHDLTRVNSGELFQLLRKIVTTGMNHIVHCELCKARGFLCEKCHSSEVIFPFQVDTVIRCEKCGSCYHRPCWNSTSCPRCQRIARRQESSHQTSLKS